jgi:hydroxylamine reductase (hybrid-cluster protein)
MSKIEMFCFQCKQTVKGKHCTTIGVCGKGPEVAVLQDLLIYSLRGLSSDKQRRGSYEKRAK